MVRQTYRLQARLGTPHQAGAANNQIVRNKFKTIAHFREKNIDPNIGNKI
jgi:hypothetical protein